MSMGLIYYIPDFFFLKYGLHKIGLLRSIFDVIELLSLSFTVIVFVHHFDDDLEENEKYNTGVVEVYNGSHNLIKSYIP